MATYFLNCSTNIENFNLCLQHNVAGFPYSGYKIGDSVYLIVKENQDWKLGGKGHLLEPTQKKPWPDAKRYVSAFNVNWQKVNKPVITDGLRNIYSNFGLAIQGKKDLDSFEGRSNEIKKYLDRLVSENNKTYLDKVEDTRILKRTPKQLIQHVFEYISNEGFHYQKDEIANFYLSLRTKPFVILAGISGTGKTQLPRKFADALGFSKESGHTNSCKTGLD